MNVDRESLAEFRRELHQDPDFWHMVSMMVPILEHLESERIHPVIDKRGDFQLAGEKEEGISRELMDRLQANVELVGRVLQDKDNPVKHEILREGVKRMNANRN